MYMLADIEAVDDAIGLMLVGMAVVFTALVLLYGMVTLINRLGDRLGQRAVAEATRTPRVAAKGQAAPAAKPAPDQSDAITPQLLAVLTAAATAAMHKPVQVTRVKFVHQNKGQLWAQMGRRSIMTSHRLPHRKR